MLLTVRCASLMYCMDHQLVIQERVEEGEIDPHTPLFIKALTRQDILFIFMLQKYVEKDRIVGGKFEKGIKF